MAKGFAPILLLIIVITATVAGIAFTRFQKSNDIPRTDNPQLSQPTSSPSPSITPTIKAASTPKITITSKPKPTAIPILTKTPTPTSQTSNNTPPSCRIDPSYAISKASMVVNFSAADKVDGASYQWDFDGDGNWDTGMDQKSSVSHTYNNPGSYTPKMQARSSGGAMSNICSSSITVNSPVSCEINPDKLSGTAPLLVNLTYGATYSGGTDNYVTNVQWDFEGDGNWDTPLDYNSQHVNHTYAQPGNYTIKMRLQTKDGYISDICTKNITVQ